MGTGLKNAPANPDVTVTTIHEEDTRLKEPGKWSVVFHNDDFTPMDFVIEVLMDYFGYDIETSANLMMNVHEKGGAIVGVYPFDIAETKMAQVINVARRREYPLLVTIEKA